MMMVLNDDQRQAFQDALRKQNDQLRPLEEKMRAAQKELIEAALASPYDEKAVRTKADAVAKIQSDIAVLRAKALSAVAPSLEAEQKRQIIESPMGAMLLNAGRGSGGMGGFGRGPGGPGGGPGGPPPPPDDAPKPKSSDK
jgi:Spy/CpxP family protein refolding chaperone